MDEPNKSIDRSSIGDDQSKHEIPPQLQNAPNLERTVHKVPSKQLRFGTIRRRNDPLSRKISTISRISQQIPVLGKVVGQPDSPKSRTSNNKRKATDSAHNSPGPTSDQYVGSKSEDITNNSRNGTRSLYFNQKLPSDHINQETGHPLVQYPRNKIRTTKYTPFSFVPKNLYYQFQSIANIYFVFIVILSAFPIFGVQNPGLSAVPIIVIVLLTAIKDSFEDYRRRVLDGDVNNTTTQILRNIDNNNVVKDNVNLWRRFKKLCTRVSRLMKATVGQIFRVLLLKRPGRSNRDKHELVSLAPNGETSGLHEHRLARFTTRATLLSMSESAHSDVYNTNNDNFPSLMNTCMPRLGHAKFKRAFWKEVSCGDVVKILENQEVPADIVVLTTSDSDGACYVETKNLDGESNLKVRQSLRATSTVKRAADLEQCQFLIEVESPHKDLYTFNGVLRYTVPHSSTTSTYSASSKGEEKGEPIGLNNVLLRGSTLRNTRWAIGMVVYTGPETKIMLNSGETPAKRSRIMRELNANVLYMFVFLVALCFVAGLVSGLYWRKGDTSGHFFEPTLGGSAAAEGVITFWAAVILLQNLIPISLYITIEIIKTVQAFFIYSDAQMYYEAIDYPCTPKSWSISDDVGQVEYIFSDKTGTLTQNAMEFKKCTVAGVPYGEALTEAMLGMKKREGGHIEDVEAYAEKTRQAQAVEKQEMIEDLREIYDNPELVESRVSFVSRDFVRELRGDSLQSERVRRFVQFLSLCHAILPERKEIRRGDNIESSLEYKAQSPDEYALVTFARDMGHTLLEKTRDGMVIDVWDEKTEYSVLSIQEFNSSRKRMSVIVRLPDSGKIVLLCKGADSVVFSRLSKDENDPQVISRVKNDLADFAREGLRTLCLAYREISEEEYHEWAQQHDEAAQALHNREEEIERVANAIEQDLVLVGGTAIEDRLQEGVPNAVALLGRAGIKLWVLTGDKVETAINIGYSCNLIDGDMETMVIEAQSVDELARCLQEHLEKFQLTGSESELAAARQDHSPAPTGHALVIDGASLLFVGETEEIQRKFVLLGKQCRSVLCCRVSPSQKAEVVNLVKKLLDVITLSVGDGANDVSMIQCADVGVGIAGVEGRQAVMCSDYAIGQFRYLTRLVLVHGRWSYIRLSEMIANLFYKNAVFTLTLFWYDVHNSFDGSYLFDYTYITLFNLAFTSLPVCFLGILDQDVSDVSSLAIPQLFRLGILRQGWTQTKFWLYTLDGLYQSAVCYFFSFCMFYNGGFVTRVGQQINNRQAFGVFAATSAILSANLYVLMNQYRWDYLSLIINCVSNGLVFFWTGIYTSFKSAGGFYEAAQQLYGALSFWAFLMLALVTCSLPRFSSKAIQKIWRPKDVDIVREQLAFSSKRTSGDPGQTRSTEGRVWVLRQPSNREVI